MCHRYTGNNSHCLDPRWVTANVFIWRKPPPPPPLTTSLTNWIWSLSGVEEDLTTIMSCPQTFQEKCGSFKNLPVRYDEGDLESNWASGQSCVLLLTRLVISCRYLDGITVKRRATRNHRFRERSASQRCSIFPDENLS